MCEKISTAIKIILKISFIFGEIISDFVYLVTQPFSNDALIVFLVIFVALIPMIIYFGSLYLLYKKIKEVQRELAVNNLDFQSNASENRAELNWLKKSLFIWIIAGPIVSFFYPFLDELQEKALEQKIPEEYKKYKNYLQLTKLKIIFQSFPQLIIQTANNALLGNWSSIAKFSFAFHFILFVAKLYMGATIFYKKTNSEFLEKIKKDIVAKVEENLSEEKRIFERDSLLKFISFKFEEKYLSSEVIFKDPDFNLETRSNLIIYDLDNPGDNRVLNATRIICPNTSNNSDNRFEFFNRNEELHIEVEELLETEYDRICDFELNLKKIFDRNLNPRGIIIFIEVLSMIFFWLLNIVYVASADFFIEALRFVILFILAFMFAFSIFGQFEKVDDGAFKKFIILRMLTVTHFSELIYFLFDKKIKEKWLILHELSFTVVCLLPILIIQGLNHRVTGSYYQLVISVNCICGGISFMRLIIGHICNNPRFNSSNRVANDDSNI